MNAHQRANFKP